MSQKVVDDKAKLKRFNEGVMGVSMSIGIINNMSSRLQNITDPVIKYSIFVDRLCLLLDMLNSGIDMGVNSFTISMNDFDESLKEEVNELRDKVEKLRKAGIQASEGLKKDCDGLMTWIQSPTYDPDHAFGKNYIAAKSGEHGML
jgi:hypothetical protein